MDHSKHKQKKGYKDYGKRGTMSVAGDVRIEEPSEQKAKKKKRRKK